MLHNGTNGVNGGRPRHRSSSVPLIASFSCLIVMFSINAFVETHRFFGWNGWSDTSLDCLTDRNGNVHAGDAPVQNIIHDSSMPRRRLEFVHIPKTGGTAIESVAARHGIPWSICHFANPLAVPQMSANETHCPKGSLKFPWPQQPKIHTCPWWHLPPQYFENQPANPYENADLFCVVRNVYDRIVSEYYYFWTHVVVATPDQVNDVINFNRWLTKTLVFLQKTMVKGDMARNRTGSRQYYYNAGHYIPQYDFVFEHRRRVTHHVLRFENLTEEFNELMQRYDLAELKLPVKHLRVSHSKKLGVYNMTRENVLLLENIYQSDFLEWGYDIMSEKIPAKIFARNDAQLLDANSKALGSSLPDVGTYQRLKKTRRVPDIKDKL